jgi:hypothetical protein
LVVVGISAGVVVAANGLAVDSGRADCPGKIECPLTGEVICRDECPLDAAAVESEVPPCCRAKK